MSIYAVNGKEPIAAWIPTISQSANDLIGGNNGTLTNGALIVADTGAGGTDAFSTDGTAQWVALGGIGALPAQGAISFWTRPNAIYAAANQNIFGTNGFANQSRGFRLERSSNGSNNLVVGNDVGSFPSSASAYSLGTIPSDQWSHIVIVWNTATNRLSAYRAGSVVVNNVSHAFWVANLTDIRFGIGFNTSRGYLGLSDDIRIFDQALNATDVTALYASGLGRGITFGGIPQTRRRRDLGGFGL